MFPWGRNPDRVELTELVHGRKLVKLCARRGNTDLLGRQRLRQEASGKTAGKNARGRRQPVKLHSCGGGLLILLCYEEQN